MEKLIQFVSYPWLGVLCVCVCLNGSVVVTIPEGITP